MLNDFIPLPLVNKFENNRASKAFSLERLSSEGSSWSRALSRAELRRRAFPAPGALELQLGSRRQLSNCYAEAFGYENHNRQRGNDEPNAPLLVEVDAAAEEVYMVVVAVLNSGATSAIKSASTRLL